VTGGGGGVCDLTPVTDILVQTNALLLTISASLSNTNDYLQQLIAASALANMKLDQLVAGQGSQLNSLSQILEFSSQIEDDTSNIRAFSSSMNNNLIQVVDRTNSTVLSLQQLNTLFGKSVDGSAPLWINRDKINVNIRPFQAESSISGPFNSNWKSPMAGTNLFRVGTQAAVRAINPNYTAPGFDPAMASANVYVNEAQVINNLAPLGITLGNIVLDISSGSGSTRNLNCLIPDGIVEVLAAIPNVPSHGSPDRAVINAESASGAVLPIHITPLLKEYEVVSNLKEASNEECVNSCNI
jgi:hypothetical protein